MSSVAVLIEARFWSKVEVRRSHRCWEWRASIGTNGYGLFMVKRKNIPAHRMAWKLCNGEIPAGKWVLHHCDNPKCVNPRHLYLGTVQDNVRDRDARKRRLPPRGSKNGWAVLSEKNVMAIKKMAGPARAVAAKFGVSRSAIAKIRCGKNWAHI